MGPLILSLLLQATPQPVIATFSSIYDQQKHRKHLPNCPSEAQAAPHLWHALDLWERQGDRVMDRIRQVTEMPGFPRLFMQIYFVACGRGISDPVTIAVYNNGPDGPFGLQTDDDLIAEITHEILHNVANTMRYGDTRYFLYTAYSNENELAVNHTLVAAFETRIYGYEATRKKYLKNAIYSRALELAMQFGVGSREPWPTR